jgi:hypothetical protein
MGPIHLHWLPSHHKKATTYHCITFRAFLEISSQYTS